MDVTDQVTSAVQPGGADHLPHGIVTFLLTDIEGSTRQWQADSGAMAAAIARHDRILTQAIVGHGGSVLTERGEGDSFFAVFPRATDAVAAATTAQRELADERWPGEVVLRVRMAIHTGEAAGDYRGVVVNRCARLRSRARGAEILVSASVRELSRDNLPDGVTLTDIGERRLRDIDRPERIFRVADAVVAAEDTAQPRSRVALWVWIVPVVVVAAGVVLAAVLGLGRGSTTPGDASTLAPKITTIAGTGVRGSSGDGGLATAADVDVAGVAVDGAGNIYVVGGNRVRKSDVNHVITTFAGTGIAGFSGDGGAATGAQLSLSESFGAYAFSAAIAVDKRGNVFIADELNQRVREVDFTGVITTVAGDGATGAGGDGGPALKARLTSPRGVAVDSVGNVFIADTENNRVREVVASSGTIMTVAGTGAGGYSGDGGAATQAMLRGPQGLALDRAGNLYVADTDNNRIRRITPSGVITTVAGTGAAGYSGDAGPARSAELNLPVAVAVGLNDFVYIADTENQRVRRVDVRGTITTVAGDGTRGFSGEGGAAMQAALGEPVGVAVDPAGTLYIADGANGRVRRVG